MKPVLHRIKYVVCDYLSALFSWTLFFVFRKTIVESKNFGYKIPIELNDRFILGLIILPFFWLFLYYLAGNYKDVYRKSRLIELGRTLLTTLIGVIIIFFTLLLDDIISSYKNYYILFLGLFSIHFILTYIPRHIINTRTIHKIHHKIIGFNTLIIGGNGKALGLFKDIDASKRSNGNLFVGFISVHENGKYLLENYIPHLGNLSNLSDIIKEHDIQEVIIAIETSEHKEIERIINRLYGFDVVIKAIPDMHDILTGNVKMGTIFSTPLIEITHELMPAWQEKLKQIIDIFVATVTLIILSPLFLFLAIGVKISSKGPVFFCHERIGMYGKPFTLYKFRSMCKNAEINGPALSSKNDSRITRFGKFMRKSKLDELPNFINVIKGDMSLVGPRPERQYYIDKIVKQAPHYFHLQKVKPGITSWGQVKYGYAENIDQMIERLKFDIIYIENMSLYVDFKILIYTILTILKGKGI